ncbi:MAG: flavodoxin [Chloroflexaceae bacterium]|nr:flavodoxin [Chloroflexaceae bacterium]
MTTIGLYYGTSTGYTEEAAKLIQREFERIQPGMVTLLNVYEHDLDAMPTYDLLILGVPTWNIGEMQEDWQERLPQLAQLDLHTIPVALFGLGDEGGYPDTYQDALGMLAQLVRERGAQLVGYWPTTGYDFYASLAVEGEHFVGLALDETTAPNLTSTRIEQWVQQIVAEVGITADTPVSA